MLYCDVILYKVGRGSRRASPTLSQAQHRRGGRSRFAFGERSQYVMFMYSFARRCIRLCAFVHTCASSFFSLDVLHMLSVLMHEMICVARVSM